LIRAIHLVLLLISICIILVPVFKQIQNQREIENNRLFVCVNEDNKIQERSKIPLLIESIYGLILSILFIILFFLPKTYVSSFFQVTQWIYLIMFIFAIPAYIVGAHIYPIFCLLILTLCAMYPWSQYLMPFVIIFLLFVSKYF
jgi:hypothetical protein